LGEKGRAGGKKKVERGKVKKNSGSPWGLGPQNAGGEEERSKGKRLGTFCSLGESWGKADEGGMVEPRKGEIRLGGELGKENRFKER